MEQVARRPGPVHPAPGPDDPGDPGHLLRPARRRATTTDEVLGLLRDAYADEPFVQVIEGAPTTKAVLGSNSAFVTARADERTGWVLALCAIDNLVKGASGQAVQCANLVAGLPETTRASRLVGRSYP